MLFILSHGQAAVERGFSINKDVIENNMLERTVVSRRMIWDGMRNSLSAEDFGDVSKLIITDEMLRYCRDARNLYRSHLKNKAAASIVSVQESKKRDLRKSIKIENEKIEKLNERISKMVQEADFVACKVEKQRKICLISEWNALRKNIEEFKKIVEKSKENIKRMEEKIGAAF